jgi:plastocyanin
LLGHFIYRLSEADYSRFSVAATAVFLLTLSFASYPEAFSQTISNNNNVSNESNSRSNNSNRSDGAEHLVTILRGAGNPTPDLTLQNVGKWYEPKALTIPQSDTVIWKNDDTEPHSVTSGIGGGLISAQTGSRGKPDSIFDSGLFQPASRGLINLIVLEHLLISVPFIPGWKGW